MVEVTKNGGTFVGHQKTKELIYSKTFQQNTEFGRILLFFLLEDIDLNHRMKQFVHTRFLQKIICTAHLDGMLSILLLLEQQAKTGYWVINYECTDGRLFIIIIY